MTAQHEAFDQLSHISTVETVGGRRQWTGGQAQRVREGDKLAWTGRPVTPGGRLGYRRAHRRTDRPRTSVGLTVRADNIASVDWLSTPLTGHRLATVATH
jgi:hypothetical protein